MIIGVINYNFFMNQPFPRLLSSARGFIAVLDSAQLELSLLYYFSFFSI